MDIDKLKEGTAYYHLPGLFEFYELYHMFLPIFREHREYFYDWCDIGSVYGAPEECIWGGGRTSFGNRDAGEVLALMREYGISARLTFSNSLLERKHLTDKKCNELCALFEKSGEKTKWSNCALGFADRIFENKLSGTIFGFFYHKGYYRLWAVCK